MFGFNARVKLFLDSLLRRSLKGYTLLEIMIVAIIAGVVATFAVPAYIATQRKAHDNEAHSQLRLIRAAERVYNIDYNGCTGCGNYTQCNNLLKITLPQDISKGGAWDYAVYFVNNKVTPPLFKAKATGTKGSKNWNIDQDGTIW